VDAEPDDEPICQGAALSTPPIPDGEIVVPDMTGVRFVDAQRRIGTVGLTWSACDGPPRAVPQQLGRFSITWLQVVTEQCPRAGQHVPAKTPIVLTTTAYLPGGYAIPGGALVSQCVNDRQAMSG
jgi:hypothetical protein